VLLAAIMFSKRSGATLAASPDSPIDKATPTPVAAGD
jgi:hypothetical protein